VLLLPLLVCGLSGTEPVVRGLLRVIATIVRFVVTLPLHAPSARSQVTVMCFVAAFLALYQCCGSICILLSLFVFRSIAVGGEVYRRVDGVCLSLA
jgi:hypothetical protein